MSCSSIFLFNILKKSWIFCINLKKHIWIEVHSCLFLPDPKGRPTYTFVCRSSLSLFSQISVTSLRRPIGPQSPLAQGRHRNTFVCRSVSLFPTSWKWRHDHPHMGCDPALSWTSGEWPVLSVLAGVCYIQYCILYVQVTKVWRPLGFLDSKMNSHTNNLDSLTIEE